MADHEPPLRSDLIEERAAGGGGPSSGRPGRRTNIADVARLAGVSTGTVSNVLNNPHRVAEQTRRRVQEVVRDTGFVPNHLARQLTGVPSTTVGLVLTDLSRPYCFDVARGLEDGLAELGCLAITCGSHVDPARERRSLQLLVEAGVRSVVLNAIEAQPRIVRALAARGIPVTLLDAPDPPRDVCAIGSDWNAGGRLAAGHLLDLGHRSIGVLSYDVQAPTMPERLSGMRRAATDRGLSPDQVFRQVPVQFPGHIGDWDGLIQPLLGGPAPCTAFVCCDDMAAISLLNGLAERGLDVPGDVSVVGYDDRPFAELLSPALTTVRPLGYQLGRAAAQLTLAEAGPAHAHRRQLVTPKLVVRGTSATPGRRSARG